MIERSIMALDVNGTTWALIETASRLTVRLRIEVDEEDDATLGHARFPGLHAAVPYEDESDKAAMKMQRRFLGREKPNRND